jgi:hypothetical protein
VLLTKRRWLLLFTMLFALGWTAAEVLTMRKECRTEDIYLLADDGSFLTADTGQRLIVDQRKQCDLVFAGKGVPLPTWAQFLGDR